MKLNEEKVLEIIILRRLFKTPIRELAKMYGVSPRRIQQVLSNPIIRKPGRRRKRVPLRVKREILILRNKGLSIDRIHERLKREGLPISKYKVWQVIKEQEDTRSRETERKTTEETARGCGAHWQGYDIGENPSLYLDVLYVPGGRKYRVLVVLNPLDLKVIHAEIDRITLRRVLEVLSTLDLEGRYVLIGRVPPLVPTRGSNRLVRYLRRRCVEYRWLDKALRSARCFHDLNNFVQSIKHRAHVLLKNGVTGDVTDLMKEQ